MAKQSDGFIKIDRKMLEWRWYQDPIRKSVFLHCLLKANWQDRDWKKTTIKRGSFFTSMQHLADELNVSRGTVIRALNDLSKTGELVKKSTNLGTLITVVNYEFYQGQKISLYNRRTTNSTTDDTTSSTTSSTTSDTQLKNTKNSITTGVVIEKNPKNSIKNGARERVLDIPTLDEAKQYATSKGYTFNVDSWMDYMTGIGWETKTGKVKNWQAFMDSIAKKNGWVSESTTKAKEEWQ